MVVSLNSRLDSNKEERKEDGRRGVPTRKLHPAVGKCYPVLSCGWKVLSCVIRRLESIILCYPEVVKATMAGEGRRLENFTLQRNVKRFRGGLVLKAHRWLYHSTLG